MVAASPTFDNPPRTTRLAIGWHDISLELGGVKSIPMDGAPLAPTASGWPKRQGLAQCRTRRWNTGRGRARDMSWTGSSPPKAMRAWPGCRRPEPRVLR